MRFFNSSWQIAVLVASSAAVHADQVILDDLIVNGSACIGQDCVNGESFGFDTIRLKENNLRIKFQDTSNSASFPSNDWQITANDSTNGGANKFSIDDIDGGRTPFTIEASAPSHSLYVDDGGRLGLGTATPVVDVHAVSGNTPTLRLEQDGSSGFTAQTWDVAGNEANFFVRDATNGSRLPFKIKPSAPTNSLFIDSDGDVGLSTASPQGAWHVENTSGNDGDDVVVTTDGFVGIGTTSPSAQIQVSSAGVEPEIRMTDADTGGGEWVIELNTEGDNLAMTKVGTGAKEFEVRANGDLAVLGSFISNGTTLNVPDYVFESSYPLMPLDELEIFVKTKKRLPNVPSGSEIKDQGLNISEFQMSLLRKVEELTLYTLEQEKTIRELRTRLASLENGQVRDNRR